MAELDEWRLEFGSATAEAVILAIEDIIRANGVEVILRIQVRASGILGDEFSGSVHCSIFGPELARFIDQLEALERSRLGEATLSSMSPGEFELGFRSIDRAGHIAVRAAISGRIYTQRGWLTNQVSAEVEIDPTRLPEYLVSFKTLARYFDLSAPP